MITGAIVGVIIAVVLFIYDRLNKRHMDKMEADSKRLEDNAEITDDHIEKYLSRKQKSHN